MKRISDLNFLCVFIALLAAWVAGSGSVSAQAPDQVGLFASVFSNSGVADRNAAEVRRRSGWPGWIETHIEPAVAWATADDPDRSVIVAVWNPFGTTSGPMQPDQFLEARDAGLDWLTDGYVDAWLSFKARHPNVRVMMYVGKPSADPTTMGLIRRGRLDEAIARRDASFAPLVAVSDLIGLDALSASPSGGLDAWTVRWLHEQGVEVVGELNPGVGQWQSDLPSTMLYKNLARMHSPDRREERWLLNVPTWDEKAWPLYAAPGRWLILNTHSGKWNDPDDMKRMVRGSVEHGCGVLIQPSPRVMQKPIGWYFEAGKDE
ncbi:MAG: hypothetical protein AAF333_13375 [Planctomycetota bacterium]